MTANAVKFVTAHEIINKNIIIAASRGKILSLFGSTLHVDTGNEEVNQMLCGYYRVIVGYEDIMMLPMKDS